MSSSINTTTLLKDTKEVENPSVNIQTSIKSFVNPTSNTSNNGLLFNFGIKNTATNTNELETNKPKLEKVDKEVQEDQNLKPKSQSTSEETKNIPTTTSGFKLGEFKFNQQSFSTSLTNKSSDFVFNDKKTSPLSKPSEIKFNATPSFNFGTAASTFSFKPLSNQNDNKPFFSFGSKSPTVTPVSDTSNKTEPPQSKDEEDEEDQPPVVNFTPIKENDAIFESKSKLYCLKNGKYEEHGIGQLYLKPIDDQKIQLLMRNDNALGTIMVNTLLNKSVNFTKRNAKNVQLICVIDPTKSTKPQTVLFKFKDSQITDLFESELVKLKN